MNDLMFVHVMWDLLDVEKSVKVINNNIKISGLFYPHVAMPD